MRLKLVATLFVFVLQINWSYEDCIPALPSQTATEKNRFIYIAPPIDSDTYMTCVGNSTSIATTYDAQYGFYKLVIANFNCPNNTYAGITIRKNDASNTIFFNVTGNVINNQIVTSQSIAIDFWQSGPGVCTFTGNMSLAPSVSDSTPRPSFTPPPPPTTRAWTGTPGTIDPWLISHDLFFSIDSGARTDGDDNFERMKFLFSMIEQQLNIVNLPAAESPTSYTRISLMQLTPYDNFATHGGIWEMSSDDFIQVINSLVYYKSGPAKYLGGMKGAADQAFTIINADGSNYNQATRNHTQRTYLLITDNLPADSENFFANDSEIAQAFQAKDIHLVVIGANPPPDVGGKYDSSASWYKYIPLTQDDIQYPKTTAQTIVSYLTRADYSCLEKELNSQWDNQDLTSTGGPVIIQEPFYTYAGPPINDGKITWNTGDGQKSRYCNFQNQIMTITNKALESDGITPKQMCLTIYHELEVEKDYVKVYNSDQPDPTKEIGFFTGLQVTGSKLSIPSSAAITIEFKTDNREVFGGFYLYVSTGVCGTTVTPPTTTRKPGQNVAMPNNQNVNNANNGNIFSPWFNRIFN